MAASIAIGGRNFARQPPNIIVALNMSKRSYVEKAVQAVGVLLRRDGKRAGRLRLLKLLYIADRECVKRTGVPILASRYVAMKHGPLHSDVLNLINGEHVGEPIWSAYFTTSGRDVWMEDEPEVGMLSRHEVEALNCVVDENADLSDWKIVDKTHEFQEWKKNYPDPTEDTSRRIYFEDVLEAVGRSADKDDILQARKDRHLRAVLLEARSKGRKVNAGDTLYIPQPGASLDSHLWIVISDPGQHTHCLIVNLTSWRSDKDQACVVESHEHPYLHHRSCVNFKDSKLVPTAGLDGLVASGVVEHRAPLSPELLEKIRASVADSRMTIDHAQLLYDQGLTDF